MIKYENLIFQKYKSKILPIDIIEEIMNEETLVLENEDELLIFINDFYEKENIMKLY